MIEQINPAELLDVACLVLNKYAGRKKFVLEVIGLICNLAKSAKKVTMFFSSLISFLSSFRSSKRKASIILINFTARYVESF